MTPSIVRVRWRDAWADHDESDATDFYAATDVETVGFLLRDTDDVISVAAESIRRDGQLRYRCITHIPRNMVVGEPEVLSSGLEG